MAFQKGNKNAKGGKRKNAGRKPDKVMRELKALASEHRERAIGRLAEWMESDNPKASVAACVAILDRSDGKPTQMLANDPENPFKEAIFVLPAKEIGEKGRVVA